MGRIIQSPLRNFHLTSQAQVVGHAYDIPPVQLQMKSTYQAMMHSSINKVPESRGVSEKWTYTRLELDKGGMLVCL